MGAKLAPIISNSDCTREAENIFEKSNGPNRSFVRIVFGSCLKQETENIKIFKPMVNLEPDVYLLLGGNVYVDQRVYCGNLLGHPKTSLEFNTSYATLLNHKDFPLSKNKQDADNKYPLILAIWNDHDCSIDNSDSKFNKKYDSKLAFIKFQMNLDPKNRLYNELKNIENNQERGIYYCYDYKSDNNNDNILSIRFYMLDVRYHRRKKDILGEEQRKWFENNIKNNHSHDWTIICSASVFGFKPIGILNANNSEKWDKNNVEWLIKLLFYYKILHKTIILTGDIHIAVAHKYGYLFELTSRSLNHSATTLFSLGMKALEPKQRLTPIVSVNNFGLIDIYKNQFNFAIFDENSKAYTPIHHIIPDNIDALLYNNNNVKLKKLIPKNRRKNKIYYRQHINPIENISNNYNNNNDHHHDHYNHDNDSHSDTFDYTSSSDDGYDKDDIIRKKQFNLNCKIDAIIT